MDRKLDKRLSLVGKMAHKLVDDTLKLHGILTPEQKEKIRKKVAKRRGG